MCVICVVCYSDWCGVVDGSHAAYGVGVLAYEYIWCVGMHECMFMYVVVWCVGTVWIMCVVRCARIRTHDRVNMHDWCMGVCTCLCVLYVVYMVCVVCVCVCVVCLNVACVVCDVYAVCFM